MPQGDQSTTAKRNRQADALERGREQKGVARPEAEARARGALNKLHGGGKNINSRQKVPFGPIGGLGRKTNLTRSS